jgi:hypothetical protein
MDKGFDERGYEDAARQMIRHENEVINFRMGWMTTLNGLLFTALGFLWDKPNSKGMITTICVVGFLVCLLSALMLYGATCAMRRIRRWWQRYAPKDYDGPGIIGEVSPHAKTHWMADLFAPWDCIAWILCGAWVWIYWIVRR